MGYERARPKTMAREEAEGLGVAAFTAMAGDEAVLNAFLAQTGLGVGELRAAVAEPAFLAAVLDHMLQDDRTVAHLAETLERDPADLMAARIALGGTPGWGVGETGD